MSATNSAAHETPGVQQLTEDSLLFDGPRATYGRFRVLHQIGAGSVGPVFRGEDSESRQPVVIKVIRVALTPERVAVVGPALRALKDRLVPHPALCPILETGVVDVEPYVVSPVVDGDSLDVAIREYGPANMADAIPRLRSLADALDAAAAVDVAHGSLHLRDIVVSVEGTVLTGIGIAPVVERVGVRPPVRRPYCAPEVALGRGISPAGDQYSLAAIAHEWLSGRRVSGPDGFQVPTSSRDGAAALAAIFSRALSAEPEHRYPTATAFVDALADVADLVVPRVRGARRRPLVAAPLLEFDYTAEDPPMTLAGDLDDLDDPPLSFDTDADAHDDAHPDEHDEPSMARVEADWNAGAAADLPLVFGPRDAGGDADAGARSVDETLSVGDTRAVGATRAVEDTLVVDNGPAQDVPFEPPTLAYESSYETLAPDPVGPLGASMARDAGNEADRTPVWVKWVGALALVVVAAVVGGRELLQRGTPSPADTATSSSPAAPAPATGPAGPNDRTPGAGDPPPGTAPAAPAASGERARVPPRDASAPPPKATSPATPPAKTVPSARRESSSPAAATPPVARPAAKTLPPPATATAGAPGRLLVRSTPSGAEVFLNGERRGVSPLAIRDLALGSYAVRIVRPGFEPAQQRVVLEAARPARAVEVSLTRAGAAAGAPPPPAAVPAASAATTGTLVVESRPSGARVIVDGVEAGVTPVTLPDAPIGSRAVRIELAGYVPIATTTRVEPGARARVAVSLTPERLR